MDNDQQSVETSAPTEKGIFYGVGVGPGDPGLVTLRAAETIRQSDIVFYLCSDRGNAMARDIARDILASPSNPGQIQEALIMPMSDSRDGANRVYDEGATRIGSLLDLGKQVSFLCQGDPFFFGSFSYLHERLCDHYRVQIIPGITSINASAALTAIPFALLAENVAIVSARRDPQDLLSTLLTFDNVAIMKSGRNRGQIIDLITQSGRIGDARYVEFAGQANQRIVEDVSALEEGPGPYFSLFLLNRQRDTGA